VVAVAADPTVHHAQVALQDEVHLVGRQPRGHLPRAHAEVGRDDERAEFVRDLIQHGRRVEAVVFERADVGRGEVGQLPREPLALVHVGNRVVAPREQRLAVEQYLVALGPDLAEAEPLHARGARAVRALVVKLGAQEVEHGLAIRRPPPHDRVRPVRLDAHNLRRVRAEGGGLHGELKLHPPLPRHLAVEPAAHLLIGFVADRNVGRDVPAPHGGHDVDVLDAHARFEAEPHVALDADGMRARVPEARVERGGRLLAQHLAARVRVAARAVVRVDEQEARLAGLDRIGDVHAERRSHAVVLADRLAGDVDARVVPHAR